ncbi:MAG: pyridoxamine 5'-phosphate oxidase family protein [Rubrivivax sp.]|nr:pyridoxamine 5'-phosphate oxidase family protein [Rubrivivax sp.]MCL4696450.1 pyridoxamine 5'-phosphate oxidase family protein [Burkholderiaceae bacterium]
MNDRDPNVTAHPRSGASAAEHRPISTVDELRTLFAQPLERALRKELTALDVHCRSFIALSPFVVLASCDETFELDASPRGGEPGFVKVDAAGRLLIPDSPGNNRLDSLANIVRTGRVGLLFMIPGFDETLRVNGRAVLSTDPTELAACADARRTPKVVMRIDVTAAYLHCAKALLRSRLWSDAARVDRALMPTAGRMIAEQTGLDVPAETKEEMERRYAPDL